MANIKEFEEKRRHKRYRVKERSFAVLGPDAVKLCHILDISKTGLSFKYFVDSDEPIVDDIELGILRGDDFYLENIPAKIISDELIVNSSSFNTVVMKRRGVQFGTLSPKQEEEVEYFIENNTICPA